MHLTHARRSECLTLAEMIRPMDDPEQAAAIGGLPAEHRSQVQKWLDALAPVVDGPRAGRGARIASAAQRMGVPPKTARNRFDALQREGWRGLLDKRQRAAAAKMSDVDCADRAAFANWIKGLAENYGGNVRHARRAAIAVWKTARKSGEKIPGYSSWPLPSLTGFPQGWSYGNLNKIAKLTQYERALSGIGRAAARPHAPMVIRTRVGLHVGEVKMADDVWHDVDCHLLGTAQREFVRYMELCILDVFSAHKESWGGKFRVRDEATGKRVNLRGTDMRFLVAHDFCNVGYWPERCLFFVEHGTAAIEDRVAEILSRYSKGAIRVETGGIQDKPAMLGSWGGRQGGNPRLKAAIESSHRLIHFAGKWLPGQTGGDSRNNLPEDHHGRERAHKELCRAVDMAAGIMPAERLQWVLNEIAAPVMAAASYARIVDEFYAIIAAFTDHELEGWEESCLAVSGFRPSLGSQDFFPYSAIAQLPPNEAVAVNALLRANPELNISRRMSRLEAFDSQRRQLRRLPAHAFVEICGEDLAVERKVRNHAIRFEDAEVARGRTFAFPAVAVNESGHEVLLKDGETYNTILDPFDTSRLFVMDARFALVGICSEQIVVSHADTEAAHRAMGQAARSEALAMLPYRMRHADKEGEADRAKATNDALLNGLVPTPEERRVRARAGAAAQDGALDDLSAALRPDRRDEETEDNVPDLSTIFGNKPEPQE
jgi:hypothetical protein